MILNIVFRWSGDTDADALVPHIMRTWFCMYCHNWSSHSFSSTDNNDCVYSRFIEILRLYGWVSGHGDRLDTVAHHSHLSERARMCVFAFAICLVDCFACSNRHNVYSSFWQFYRFVFNQSYNGYRSRRTHDKLHYHNHYIYTIYIYEVFCCKCGYFLKWNKIVKCAQKPRNKNYKY